MRSPRTLRLGLEIWAAYYGIAAQISYLWLEASIGELPLASYPLNLMACETSVDLGEAGLHLIYSVRGWEHKGGSQAAKRYLARHLQYNIAPTSVIAQLAFSADGRNAGAVQNDLRLRLSDAPVAKPVSCAPTGRLGRKPPIS